MALYLHNENPRYELKGKRIRIKRWLRAILDKEHKSAGNINVILTTDEELVKINKAYLQRSYYTDVIAFPYSGKPVDGDIYISMDRVQENAAQFGNKLEQEMLRVMAHGILHLCGYTDQTEESKKVMSEKEERYLRQWEE